MHSAPNTLDPVETIPMRAIAHRTRGHRRGPITRLISPGDVGEMVKPFIFLDLFEIDAAQDRGFAPHPHSGIATLTTFLDGSMTYADTTGKSGSLSAGAVEWMRAGGGVWHAGHPAEGHAMRGYQLWVALPPELELAPPESQYFQADRIEQTGPARVLLGSYEGKKSPIGLALPITYLHVRLKDGERWTYRPNTTHDVAWVAVNMGRLRVEGTVLERELAVFAHGNDPIEIAAEGEAELVVGSASKHPYPIVSGHYSVHTSQAALEQGERNIAALERSPAVAAIRA